MISAATDGAPDTMSADAVGKDRRMGIDVKAEGVDVGIVTADGPRAIEFYGGVLGLAAVGEMKMPGGMHMHRFQAGLSVLKVVVLPGDAPAAAPPGGIAGASGYRYITLKVNDIEAAVETCRAAGARIAIPVTELRPGVTIAMVEDPDGNWVEFLAM